MLPEMPRDELQAWRQGYERLTQLDAVWPDEEARRLEIGACREWLRSLSDFPRLRRLAGLFTPEMSRRALWCALTPCERVASHRRVTDADILVRTQDAPCEPSECMPVSVVAENIRSPFNIGGIFRTAAFLGMQEVVLCGYSSTPDEPRVRRAALGGEQQLRWRHRERTLDTLAELRAGGVALVALETAEGAAAPETLAWPFPCALVLGNERFGLGAECLAAVDHVVAIPSHGGKHSLNVVSALAICGYAARCAWQKVR